MRLRPLALGAILGAGVCSGAAAQTPSGPGGVPAVSPQRDYSFDGKLTVLYDDNVARGTRALAALRSVKPFDTTYTPSASVSVTQPLGQNALFLKGSGGYQFHQQNKKLDRYSYDFTGGVVSVLGACRAAATGTFRGAQVELDDLQAGASKNTRKSTGELLALECGRSSGLGGGLALSRTESKNSAINVKTSDSNSQSVSVFFGYRNPTLGTLVGVYSYNTSEFPNRIIVGRPIGDGFFTESFGASASHTFGQNLTVSANASQTHLKREFAPPGAKLKIKGTTYGADISYKLGQKIDLSASANRSIVPSNRPGKLYDTAQGVDAGIDYRLGRQFTISASHAISKVDSNQDTTSALRVVTNSKANTTSAAITFKQSLLSISLNASYTDREANLPEFNYNATRVGLTAGVSF